MIMLAGVTENDIVYDLGCGDGRIVLAAARQAGCRAVGFDIDLKRVNESRENALREGLSDRVSFYEQNLFDVNLGKATVVMLFLYPHVNIRLRPKLLNELRPGARVVSHSHTMEDWAPDRSARANWRNLYFWVIPARVEGIWHWEADLGNGPENYSMELTQSYQRFSGSVKSHHDKKGIKKGRLSGEKIAFNTGNSRTELHFAGIVRQDSITGTIRKDSGETIPWSAARKAEETRRGLLKLLGIY
jgi:SAM-dependent methyltransferase